MSSAFVVLMKKKITKLFLQTEPINGAKERKKIHQRT